MESTTRKKIVYTDNSQDIAIVGHVVKEDDFFLEVLTTKGKLFKIGKSRVVVIKDYFGGVQNG